MRNETMFDLPRVDAAQLERWNAGGRHPMTAETLDELDVKILRLLNGRREEVLPGISRKKWTRASAPSRITSRKLEQERIISGYVRP